MSEWQRSGTGAIVREFTPEELREKAEASHRAGVWDLSHARNPLELGPLGYTSWLLSMITLRGTSGRILDAGGGDGCFGTLVLGNIRHFLCDLAIAGLSKHDSSTIPVAADLTSLPYSGGSFGAIVANDVLEHLPEELVPQALAEMARVLTPGGVLVLNTSCWGIYWRRLAAQLRGEKGRLDRFDLEDGHLNRFTEQELVGMFNRIGLLIERRWHYKHLFQPLLRVLVDEPLKLILGGGRRSKAEGGNMETPHMGIMATWLDWLRAAWALLDVLCFGWWLSGGATVWRLRKSN